MNVKAADRVRALVTAIASAILLYALFVSATHIAHVGHFVGLRDFEANTLFILVDVPIVVGKLMVLRYFAPTTRRSGRRLMVAGLVVSLACNITSGLIGGGYGAAGYGAFVVVMAFAMENAIGKIKPAGAVTRAKAPAATETPAPRRAVAKATTRKPRAASVAQLEKAYALPSAPVSPAG